MFFHRKNVGNYYLNSFGKCQMVAIDSLRVRKFKVCITMHYEEGGR